jgi:hypothetical protein
MKKSVKYLNYLLLAVCFFSLTLWVGLMAFFFGIGLIFSFIGNYFKKSIHLQIKSTK